MASLGLKQHELTDRALGLNPLLRQRKARLQTMWQAFGAAITVATITSANQDEVVVAAKATFMKLHRWIVTGENTR